MLSLSVIASEIRRDWKAPHFGAAPYLAALALLDSVHDNYGDDSVPHPDLYIFIFRLAPPSERIS